ncbi:hypothetical protein [Endothiovibrio diazotrophicus]
MAPVVLLLVMIVPRAQGAGAYYDLSLDVGREDNLLRAAADVDRLADSSLDLTAAVGYPVPLGEHSGLYLRGALERIDYARYNGFDQLRLSGSVGWRYKPDLHYTAPWYALALKLSAWEFDQSELRDSRLWELSATTGRRLTDRVAVRAGAAYRERRATTGRVGWLSGERLFDTANRSLFAGLDYRYGGATWYGRYTVQWGDVVSTATWNPAVYGVAREAQFDDAAPVSASGRRRTGYRLDATSRLLDLGVNLPVGRATAIDLAAQYVDVAGAGGNDYHGLALHAAWLYRF